MSERPPDVPTFSGVHPDVARERRAAREARELEEAEAKPSTCSLVAAPFSALAGVLFFATRMCYLVIAPSLAGYGETVNLQRLTMGETFTIVGAILSGFAWPKP